MRRPVARWFFIVVCGALATVLGFAAALLYSPPGRRLLARLLSEESPRLVRGTVHIGALSGRWVNGFAVDSVVIRDTTGAVLASIPHLRVRYRLADIWAGKFIVSQAVLLHPDIQITKHRSGRLNYEEVFRLNEGPGGPGPSPLIEIDQLRIDSGRVLLRLPWNPDGRLHSQRQIDSALAYEKAKPGRRIEPGPEGLEMIRVIDRLDANLPLFRLATPERAPVTLQIEHLAAQLSDPRMEIRDLRAAVRTKDDSLIFDIDKAELPGTSLRGSGRIDWPRDTILYHFSFQAPVLALADLRWVSPGFPDYTGSARVEARSVSGSRTEYNIRNLSVGDSTGRVDGGMVAITDVYRGLGFRDLALTLKNLNLDAVRPYLDTLPFHGKLTGRLGATGFFGGMTVSLDWLFQDAKVPGGAESRLALNGPLRLGGADGMFFQGARLTKADIDLRTVRLVAPAVILEGRLGLAGTLTGPWKNVVFRGAVDHQDEARRRSHLAGMVRLDTRGAILGVETDVVLDSLAFDGIRRTFPTLKATGALGGRVKLAGTLDHLAIDADVAGGLGRIEAHGRATLQPPKWGADSLRIDFSRLDLAALMGAGPATDFAGVLEVTGTVDSAVAPVGQLAVTLGPGAIREFKLDSATALVHAADSLITLDTLRVDWQGGRLDGSGTIGSAPPRTGRMTFHLDAPSFAAFDSLALALTGFTRDTTIGDVVMRGQGRADATLEGALGALTIQGTAGVDSLRWLGYRARNLQSRFTVEPASRLVDLTVSADSIGTRKLVFDSTRVRVRGRSDSLQWDASGRGKNLAHLSGSGRLRRLGEDLLVHADSLSLDLTGRTWALVGTLDARLQDSLIVLDTVRLVTADGSGSIQLAGSVPGRASGDLSVTGLGIQVQDVYALAQLDTTGVAGTLSADGRLAGTSAQPTLRGTGALTGGVFGDFKAPLVRAAFDYREQLLQANLTFWRTGSPVVEVDARLPYDLAFRRVEKRQLPGPISIIAKGDSIDLAIVEAFTPNLRRMSGSLDLDVRVEGSWAQPRLAGRAQVTAGAAEVPALGVRYGPVYGAIRFNGDSILTDSLKVGGATGELTISGGIRLVELTQPALALTLSGNDFEIMDVPNYMKLRTWGDVQLSGSITHPVLTGAGRIENSVIYFADLVSKDIVNLEDPMNADLVDTLALRQQHLLATFQSRFLDSLTIRDLDFIVAQGVWLRSNEANFQLEGRVRVNKTRRIYRIDGNLNTPRGTYTLKVGGLINRTFTVERGTVRYFGDLNAELDVQARHVVQTPQGAGGDIPVIAHITGTLEVPKLELTTPPDRPPMAEPVLISLLVFGTTDPATIAQLGSSQQSFQYAVAVATNALSTELARSLISGPDAALDLVEIRAGYTTTGLVGGSSPYQIAIGKALSSKIFLSANAGFCTSAGSTFGAQNLGASLEYRFRPELRGLISAEPVQTCYGRGVDVFITQKRYQFGAELRWNRDY
jgi:hypothetical protein